jgi:uncharacterized protein DUF6459
MVPGPQRPVPVPPPVALPSRLPLPAAGPSFDDQAGLDLLSPQAALPGAGRAQAPAASVGGSGPADSPADSPSAAPPENAGPPPHSAAASPGAAGGRPADGPDTGAWASLFAQALAEALAGSRPARQIAPWTTEQARRRIRQLGPVLQGGPRPIVRRVVTSAPRRDVVEMTVIIGVGPRTRAIAVRLERARASPARPGRGRPWICTAIEAA